MSSNTMKSNLEYKIFFNMDQMSSYVKCYLKKKNLVNGEVYSHIDKSLCVLCLIECYISIVMNKMLVGRRIRQCLRGANP